MTDPRPQYVIRLEGKGLLWTLFIFTVLTGIWFLVVLVGETQDYGDNPGRWAYLPTAVWGFLAAAFALALLVYALALLTIRERPGQLYRLEDEYATAPDTNQPVTPSFLRPEPAPPEATAEAEPEPSETTNDESPPPSTQA